MKKLFLPMALMTMVQVSAQWAVFPLGQRSYFKDLTQSNDQVDLVLMDSSRTDPAVGTYLYNRATIHEQLFGPCAGPVVQQMASMYQGMGYPAPMDSLLERNDTVFHFSNLSTLPFIFLPKAAVGQSWTVSSTYSGNAFSDITVTCTGIGVVSFLGITDSVKTFSLEAIGAVSPINDLQVRLSKHHGLVEYVPFEQFLYHPYWIPFKSYLLIGMESGGTIYNYHQPGFWDYFHLTPGDVLQWRTDEHPWDISQPSTTTFRRDSVVAVSVTPDSVTYICDGTRILADGSVVPFQGLQLVYRKAEVGGLLGSAPNDWAVGGGHWEPAPSWLEYNGVWRAGPLQLSLDQNGADTITSFGFNAWGAYIEASCLVLENVDWSYEWRADTRAGLNWHCENFGLGTNCTELIGSRINGELDGDITVGLADQTGPGNGLSVRPNPATDRIMLPNAVIGAGMPYAVLDDMGREVQQGMLDQGNISVRELPQGLYVLRIFTANDLRSVRFVKE